MNTRADRTAASPSRPFGFETEFDDMGGVRPGPVFRPTKRAYLPAEVEALTAQARLEGREAALAEIESMRVMAMSEIAQSVAASTPALAALAQAHREQAAGLALAAARVVAGAALERFPAGPLQEALEALGAEIDAAPRLVVRTRGLDEVGQAQLQAVAVDAGFSGLVSFRDDPGMAPAAFQLEWADGRADFDPAEAASRIEETVVAALAAEAGHAESLAQPDHRRP
ncbi:flagellar assembly protein FlbE [Brevundimonas sp.]|uniref:flagellar assembly protein FlbE n=2 Tax=Brevundimonas sp. TaxID=1871086 RepID=UPI004033D4EA